MNPRILIIDDDIELNELLCEFFESNNAVVEHAIKPSSGLKKLREFSPDLVVLDVMPVSYTHLRAHETVLDLVCRLLLEKKQKINTTATH